MIKRRNSKTVGIFIDFENFFYAQRNIPQNPYPHTHADIKKLVDFLTKNDKLFYVYIYISSGNGIERCSFIHFLKKQGYAVRTKERKIINETKNKCNFDVELAIDVIDLLHTDRLPERIIFITGDSDFAPLLSRLKNENYTIEILSSYKSLSNELKEIGDEIYLLEDIWEKIKK